MNAFMNMSAGSQSFSNTTVSNSMVSNPKFRQGQGVLGELLHSLSQPLTGLRCSLELSLACELPLELQFRGVAEQQHENVAIALQQTEKVIGMFQLMREYVDAERAEPAVFSTALLPVLRNLTEELSSIGAVRDVQVRLTGSCTATVPVAEARLRLALQYLITTAIEAQPPGGGVLLALTESPAGTVLRMEGEGDRASDRRKFHRLERNELAQGAADQRDAQNITLNTASATTSATTLTLRRVKVAIASRVLEAAGASLVFGDGGGGDAEFVLRIPRSKQNPDTNK
jgi:signal transduction histidine kinase